jgi:hypothetical protein
MPPVAQRALRDLTRYRSPCNQEQVTLISRVQKRLEEANIKLAAVASDIMGVSGRASMAPQALADLAKGRLRRKRAQLAKALDGRVKPHHRFVLTALFCQIDRLETALPALMRRSKRSLALLKRPRVCWLRAPVWLAARPRCSSPRSAPT